MKLTERLQASTPAFFKKVRTIGLILAAMGGALLASPVVLPAVVVQVGSYLVLAGSVASAVSQTAVEGE